MAIVSEWVESVSCAARAKVPLVFSVRGSNERVRVVRGRVVEVGVDAGGGAFVAVDDGKGRFVAAIRDVLACARPDGRPWTAGFRKTDERAELRERADEHQSNGGIE